MNPTALVRSCNRGVPRTPMRFAGCREGDHVHVLWLAILTPGAAAAAVICLIYALTSPHH